MVGHCYQKKYHHLIATLASIISNGCYEDKKWIIEYQKNEEFLEAFERSTRYVLSQKGRTGYG